jgi:hypothetical protein
MSDWYELVFRIGSEPHAARLHIGPDHALLIEAANEQSGPAVLVWEIREDGVHIGTVKRDPTRRYMVRPMQPGFIVTAMEVAEEGEDDGGEPG